MPPTADELKSEIERFFQEEHHPPTADTFKEKIVRICRDLCTKLIASCDRNPARHIQVVSGGEMEAVEQKLLNSACQGPPFDFKHHDLDEVPAMTFEQ